MRPPVRDSATPNVNPRAHELCGHRMLHGLLVDPEHNVAELRLDGLADIDLFAIEQLGGVVKRAGPRRDAHFDAFDTRRQEREGHRPGAVEDIDATLQRLGQTGLAGPPGPKHPAHNDALFTGSGHAGAQVRQDGPVEHLGHLVGDAGYRVDDLVAERADQARRRPPLLLDDGGTDGHVGLALVVLRHGASACREEPGDHLDDGLIAHEFDPHDVGDRLSGDVILGRTEAAADDDSVTAGQRGPKGQRHSLVVVPDGLMEMRRHAGRGQPVAQPRGVGVGDLAEQQLGPDGHDLDPHASASLDTRRPSATYCNPVAIVKAAATQITTTWSVC